MMLFFMKEWIIREWFSHSKRDILILGVIGGTMILLSPQPFIYFFIALLSFLFICTLVNKLYTKKNTKHLTRYLIHLFYIVLISITLSSTWWLPRIFYTLRGGWINITFQRNLQRGISSLSETVIPVQYLPIRYGVPFFISLFALKILITKKLWYRKIMVQ